MESLYQKEILFYARKSRNSSVIEQTAYRASLNNPICGDRVDISLAIKAGIITDVGLKVLGCALCEAGAGLVIDCLTGKPAHTVHKITTGFSVWLEGDAQPPPMPKMEYFSPVREIRNRHKCVLLAFHTSAKALEGTDVCN